MNLFPNNPRLWTDTDREKLKANLIELGDISGVVHELNTDTIPCGNFRSSIIDINACQIEIVRHYDTPDAQGTVAVGFILWDGQRLNYRQVRWTKEQCDKACITANSLGGNWDFDILMSGDWDIDMLRDNNIELPTVDYSDLEGLEANSFRSQINNSGQYQMTFVFSKEERPLVETFVNEHGKDYLQEQLLNFIKDATVR